jgi:3-deoxy-D-arabino-heptulosonate 7-phosphate (DAHP) synthase class II
MRLGMRQCMSIYSNTWVEMYGKYSEQRTCIWISDRDLDTFTITFTLAIINPVNIVLVPQYRNKTNT